MLDITNLYAYRIEELAVGIVRAESYEDAREKVKKKHINVLVFGTMNIDYIMTENIMNFLY